MSVVLVVDDEPALLDVVGDFVAMLGHDVVRAHDGEEALDLVRVHNPALVITDHMMPRRTGLGLARALRDDPALEKIPVILMSAVHPHGLDGRDVYIKKPFDLKDLERLIMQSLEHRVSKAPAEAPTPITMSADEMLQWVAHAIKNPLAAARARLQLVDRSLEPGRDGRAREHLRGAEMAFVQIARLMTSLLDASQLADGKVELHLERGDLVALVERVVRAWRTLEPKATFIVKLPNEPVMARFDGQWLELVLDNLVSNAVRHGASPEAIAITLTATPTQVELEICDHGRGIAPNELPHLFQRFRRADAAAREGHGIGLYIAAEVVRMHGGSIDVRSNPGEGATFVVKLPK